MSRISVLAGVIGAIMASSAMAGPVAVSLRPEARPAPEATGMLTRGPLTRSLRPLARPAGFDALDGTSPVSAAATPELVRWIGQFRRRALARGISPRVFDAAFRGVRYDTEAIAKDRNQAEFKTNIWDYLDNVASPPRIEEGKRMLRKYAHSLRRIEKTFDVDKEIVVAIWGMESRYGADRGDHEMIDALATLAHDGRRGRFFEKQLIAALKIVQSGDVRLSDFKGSWAGAMGHTQFMPTSYLAYAVDFTGDGRRDVWSDDPTDALASTAAYLHRFGWTKGQPWGVEVRLPPGFSTAQASRSIRHRPPQWARIGVTDMSGKPVPDYGPAAILLPAGRPGPAFMIFDNFSVLERYNSADAYVIGVGHLADRISGGPAIRTPWPRGYEPLSFDQRKEVQRRLMQRGFKLEKVDGLIGANTRAAIRAYQEARGLTPDGFPSKEVLQALRGG